MHFIMMCGYKKDGDLLDEEELEQEFQATEFEHTTRWINSETGTKNVLDVYNKTIGYYESSYGDYRSTEIYIPLTVFNPEDLNV